MTPNNKRNIRLFLLGALLGLAAFLVFIRRFGAGRDQ